MNALLTGRTPVVLDGTWSAFLIRRFGRLLIALVLLVTISFLMIHLVPGDPVRASLGITAPLELVEARRESLGLNDPLIVQYFDFWSGLVHGDLGTSMASGLPASETIGNRLPATVNLSLMSFAVVMIISIPLGLIMALLTSGGRGRRTELAFTSTSAVIGAIPEFLLAVGLVFVFGVTLAWLPVAGLDGLNSYILPVTALALGPAVGLARIVRIEALAVIGQDFVRTARAKRMSNWRLFGRHVFPNALTSTLTVAGLLLGGMITGTVLVETVFAWPGLGMTTVNAILTKDYPLAQATILLYGTIVLVVNLVVDILLALADPRSTIKQS